MDDDQALRRGFARCLEEHGLDVDEACDAAEGLRLLATAQYDAILSDVHMPGLNGLEFLKAVRARDLDVPVILVTGQPSVDSAAKALEFGALDYLMKPVEPDVLIRKVDRALQLHQMTLSRLRAAEVTGDRSLRATDRIGLQSRLDSALASLYLAFQPIVHAADGARFGHEALLRSDEPALPTPVAVLEAAERLGRLGDVGRITRARAAQAVATGGAGVLFVNLHPRDLFDPDLLDATSPLARIAPRVVLEITERASLDTTEALKEHVAGLRRLGFRIAIDDLGAGYSGLTTFALLEPEFIKLDMTLVRDVHASRIKQRLIRSMTRLAKEMNIMTVAEGIETLEERDALVNLGCDLLQGYLIARPAREFPPVAW